MLHLQCATGESDGELAELGALVTGVDISAEALDVARERWPDIAWVEADVHDLPSELKRGALRPRLHGRRRARRGCSTSTRGQRASSRRCASGGDLLLHEEHPVSQCVDASLRWREDYFDNEPHVYRGWSHFELTGPPATEEKVERFWRLGQVVTALARAGLVLRQLEEYPGTTSWRKHPSRVPGTYIVSAQEAVVSNEVVPGNQRTMGVAVGLILLAFGAILTWAVDAEVSGLNVTAVGVILMIVGLLVVILDFFWWRSWTWYAAEPGAEPEDVRARHCSARRSPSSPFSLRPDAALSSTKKLVGRRQARRLPNRIFIVGS